MLDLNIFLFFKNQNIIHIILLDVIINCGGCCRREESFVQPPGGHGQSGRQKDEVNDPEDGR